MEKEDRSTHAVAIFNKLATVYQEKFMDVSSYAYSLDLFCNNIEKNSAEVLELACGPGNITRYLHNKRPDFKILGTDLSANMLGLARINNPETDFQMLDCRELERLTKTFDAIMCSFCLPYLAKDETAKLLADASGLLNPCGLIYLSTMENPYEHSQYKKGSSGDEIFTHYYDADFLVNLLEENWFKIIDITRQEYTESDGTKTTDVIIIARKDA